MQPDISVHGFLKFHKGVVNILIHAIGIALAIYGVWMMNWVLIIVAPLIMEGGHIYNHIRKIEPYPLRVLPLQTATYILFLGAVYIIKAVLVG